MTTEMPAPYQSTEISFPTRTVDEQPIHDSQPTPTEALDEFFETEVARISDRAQVLTNATFDTKIKKQPLPEGITQEKAKALLVDVGLGAAIYETQESLTQQNSIASEQFSTPEPIRNVFESLSNLSQIHPEYKSDGEREAYKDQLVINYTVVMLYKLIFGDDQGNSSDETTSQKLDYSRAKRILTGAQYKGVDLKSEDTTVVAALKAIVDQYAEFIKLV